MDNAINDIVMQLVDYQIDEWKPEGEEVAADDEDLVNRSGPPIRKLFIANLSSQTTFVQLRRLFSAYGKVVDVHIMRDKITHAKKKFGFVTFKNPEDALRVLRLKRGEIRLHRRILYLAPADNCHQPVELPDGRVEWNHRRKQESTSSEEEDLAVGVTTVPSKKEEVTEDKVKRKECKINILNDDCLRYVFSFLNNKERIRIERVCKRWQALSMDMWLCQKHLDFTSVLPMFSSHKLNMHILESFLRRCGENLSSLSLTPNTFTADVPKIIANYCKNLHCLNLSGLPVTSYSLGFLTRVCRELRYLCMNDCSGASDKDYQILFRACPQLETVKLARNSSINGKCLYGLKDTRVKKLVLDECNNLCPKNLMSALCKLEHLSHLSLNACGTLTSRDVSTLAQSLPKLQSLSMAQYFPLFRRDSLEPVGILKDLIRLNLQLNPSVNDQVMETIAQNCKKLQELNITGCSVHSWDNKTLTNVGVKCLALLPNLIELKMSYLACVTDESLEAIASKCNLRRLVCRGCPTFTDVGCTRILSSCNELQLFDFSGCDLVSNITLQAALDAVKLRTNNIKLKLVVGGTCVYDDQCIRTHPLLVVEFIDLCVPHLRPDYVDDIYFPTTGSLNVWRILTDILNTGNSTLHKLGPGNVSNMENEVKIFVKWGGKEYEICHLSQDDSVATLKNAIHKETGVRPERQKLLNLKLKGKSPEDDCQLSALKLKQPFKVMMMGSLEEDIADACAPPDDIPEVVNDLDIEDEEVAIESSEVYLAKIERRVREYKINILNQPRPGKKLLVLDIDYTLYDHRSTAETGYELMRPFLHEFLTSAYQDYDIVIWSATSMMWIEEKMKLLGVSTHSDYKVAFYLDNLAMISIHTPKYGVVQCSFIAG
ncbi:hypothetical protein L9F63_010842, partial [Diploptera punctata]